MNILAFDTCFDACSACAASLGSGRFEVLASASERFETGHAERLVPMIGEVMARAGLEFADIDRLAVTVGPGTFTGTRIGIAAARGLAMATGIPVVGTSSLAVMAEVTMRELGPREADDLLVAVDARRGEVYAQLFGTDARDVQSPPLLLRIEEAARLGRGGSLLIVGSGAAAVAEVATRAGRRATAALADLLPEAAALATLAVGLFPSREPVAPLYLRPPDAKPQDAKSIARAPQ